MENLTDLITHYWWGIVLVAAALALLFGRKVNTSFGGDIIEINATQAAELLEQKQAVVIDISEKRTFDKRHIPESTSLPGITFIDGSIDVADFPHPIILVPMKGIIPMPVVDHLLNHGAPKIYKLKGGVEAWRDAGFPVACS